MNNNIIENIKNIIVCEWLMLLVAFLLLLFRRQCFNTFEEVFHLVNHLLLSFTAMIGFVTEAFFVFAGHIGMHGSLYLSEFYANHLLPWFFFVLIIDIVFYIIERIIFILKTDFIVGRRFLSGARINLLPYEKKDLVVPSHRIVLLQ